LETIQWQNTIGGSNDDYLTSFKQTADGGSIIGGRTPSNISGDKTEDGNGSFDYWIVKISNKYNLITGQIFIDLNSNGIHDNGESMYALRRKLKNKIRVVSPFSDQSGNYSVLVIDSGNFTVSPQSVIWYNLSFPELNLHLCRNPSNRFPQRFRFPTARSI
jgi:hypothetical protein